MVHTGILWRDAGRYHKVHTVTLLLFLPLSQTLLKNNGTARFFTSQLAGTEWTVEDVSNFLTKHSEDTRPHGTAFTWREVFNETDQAIMSISRFMEVSLSFIVSLCVAHAHTHTHAQSLGPFLSLSSILFSFW